MEGKPYKKYILLVIIPILMFSYYRISSKFKREHLLVFNNDLIKKLMAYKISISIICSIEYGLYYMEHNNLTILDVINLLIQLEFR